MDRRYFVKLCGSALALATAGRRVGAGAPAAFTPYERVKLVNADGSTLTAGGLVEDESYVFFYPYVGTPCYLIRLGVDTEAQTLRTADNAAYDWAGGTGPDGRVVAFSAICTHLMTHPTREISFINYHTEADNLSGRPRAISCCAHGSVFDPSRGARVVSGPATQPLTAIALEHDPASGELYAIGTYGAEVYDAYFKAFRTELRRAFGRGGRAREPVAGTAEVEVLKDFTANKIQC
jgi:arsenite oxidase small subunit